MCWMCDNPGRTAEDYLDTVRAKITSSSPPGSSARAFGRFNSCGPTTVASGRGTAGGPAATAGNRCSVCGLRWQDEV